MEDGASIGTRIRVQGEVRESVALKGGSFVRKNFERDEIIIAGKKDGLKRKREIKITIFKLKLITTDTVQLKRLRWSRGSVLAFGTQIRRFKPGRRIFQGAKFLSTPSFKRELKPFVP